MLHLGCLVYHCRSFVWSGWCSKIGLMTVPSGMSCLYGGSDNASRPVIDSERTQSLDMWFLAIPRPGCTRYRLRHRKRSASYLEIQSCRKNMIAIVCQSVSCSRLWLLLHRSGGRYRILAQDRGKCWHKNLTLSGCLATSFAYHLG